MNTLWDDLSPAGLTAANEANLAAWLPEYGKLGQYYEDNPPGVKRSITNIAFPMFNCVTGTQLEEAAVEHAIQVVQADARARQVPVTWRVTVSDRPEDLGRRLEAAGFVRAGSMPCMAADLAQLNESIPEPAGLSIQRAQDPDAWRLWGRIRTQGFGIAVDQAALHEQCWETFLRAADPEKVFTYTGFIAGQAIATSQLFLAAGVAGIYNISTLPVARRRGIGAWMTLQALLYARSVGYRVGTLYASKMGAPIYPPLGFREHGWLAVYRWAPEI